MRSNSLLLSSTGERILGGLSGFGAGISFRGLGFGGGSFGLGFSAGNSLGLGRTTFTGLGRHTFFLLLQ